MLLLFTLTIYTQAKNFHKILVHHLFIYKYRRKQSYMCWQVTCGNNIINKISENYICFNFTILQNLILI